MRIIAKQGHVFTAFLSYFGVKFLQVLFTFFIELLSLHLNKVLFFFFLASFIYFCFIVFSLPSIKLQRKQLVNEKESLETNKRAETEVNNGPTFVPSPKTSITAGCKYIAACIRVFFPT